ncbi:MAG: DUF2141 domain-containing protein, partial [Thermoanaerobaculia bacterium]|nr:DUF2141 domain-containing protein [Thermoanaerobaculia bacterium]
MSEILRKICVAVGLLLTSAISRPAIGAEIVVEIDPHPGEPVVVTVYDSANAFGDLRDPIREEICDFDRECIVTGLPPGGYAVVVFADANGNRILDRNLLGIPTEPIGFANGYRPKGPPLWERASLSLMREQSRTIAVRLERPLGERGRVGVGPGVILRTSPYRDDDSLVAQPIPAITWQGNRVQIFGPRAQVGILGAGDLRLAATARLRIGVYEEDDSPVLDGLGDRDETLMAGLAVVADLPAGIELALRYDHDLIDRIGGGEAEVSLSKSFQTGRWIVTPELTAQWMSADLADHDFGVPEAASLPG